MHPAELAGETALLAPAATEPNHRPSQHSTHGSYKVSSRLCIPHIMEHHRNKPDCTLSMPARPCPAPVLISPSHPAAPGRPPEHGPYDPSSRCCPASTRPILTSFSSTHSACPPSPSFSEVFLAASLPSISYKTCAHRGLSRSESPEADCLACFLLCRHIPSSSSPSQTHLPSSRSSTGCTLAIPITLKTLLTRVASSGRVSPATSSILACPPTSKCSWAAGIAIGSYQHNVSPIALLVQPTRTMSRIWIQTATIRIPTSTTPLVPTTRSRAVMHVIVGVHGRSNHWCNCADDCGCVLQGSSAGSSYLYCICQTPRVGVLIR